MASFRQSFLAAIVKHLLRGKSLIQSILAFWLGSTSASTAKVASSTTQTTLEDSGKDVSVSRSSLGAPRTVDEFLREAEALILGPCADDGLLRLSRALKAQFRERLLSDPACMLPSYSHKLPHGHETGRYLALDVGGSTLRVALVELRGQGEDVKGRESEIVSLKAYPIASEVKSLKGAAFFDWMACRINETLETEEEHSSRPSDEVLPMSLSWSFPIEQTSARSGLIQGMGKGFHAADDLLGQDLGEVIEAACRRSGLAAELRVILNDGNATLLSRAYTHRSTRFGLILGTGVNIAAYLPLPLMGASKLGERPQEWLEEARSVIVNTELGMFGKDALPVTRWDSLLKAGHARPDFQPLEQMVSGMYLGEVARFALLEAIRSTGVFGGIVPENLAKAYSLSTETLSVAEGDTSPGFEKAIAIFSALHPSTHVPTTSDITFLRSLSAFITRRSAAIIAASLHAIWELRLEGVRESMGDAYSAEAEKEVALERTMIAFNGSVIENYPGYRSTCEDYVNELVVAGGTSEPGVGIDLVLAKESSLMGAGVALASVLSEAS